MNLTEQVVTREAVEEHLGHDELDKMKMVAALTASATLFTANHWGKFLKEVGFSEEELSTMPGKRWFVENVQEPAIQAATILTVLL